MKALSMTSQATTPADPLREALVAALSEAREAQQALEHQRGAIERTRMAMRSSQKTIKAAEDDVFKVQQEYATALASETAVPTGAVQAARQAVVDANDQFEALHACLLNSGPSSRII